MGCSCGDVFPIAIYIQSDFAIQGKIMNVVQKGDPANEESYGDITIVTKRSWKKPGKKVPKKFTMQAEIQDGYNCGADFFLDEEFIWFGKGKDLWIDGCGFSAKPEQSKMIDEFFKMKILDAKEFENVLKTAKFAMKDKKYMLAKNVLTTNVTADRKLMGKRFIVLAQAWRMLGKLDKAIATLRNSYGDENSHFARYYNVACYESLAGRPKLALKELSDIIKYSWDGLSSKQKAYHRKLLETDPDLNSIRKTKQFKRLLKKAKV